MCDYVAARVVDCNLKYGFEGEDAAFNGDRTRDGLASRRRLYLVEVRGCRSRVRRANVRGLVDAGGGCVLVGEGRHGNERGDQGKKEDLHSRSSCCFACLKIRTRRLRLHFILAI